MSIIHALKRKVVRLTTKLVRESLKDLEVRTVISEIQHHLVDLEKGMQGNIRSQLWRNATKETAEYVEKKMLNIASYKNRDELFGLSLSKAPKEGLILEFGVASGHSINLISKLIEGTVHGFDSFEGLPEHWFDKIGKGSYATNHQLIDFNENVEIHVGLFDQTLPEFVKTYKDNISFMHIDCDLYSSTKVVLDILSDRICSGTVIQFDEYFNFPGWKEHEFKAFQEFVSRTGLKYDYLGYDRNHFSAAVIIK